MIFVLLPFAKAAEWPKEYSDRRLNERVEPLENKVRELENQLLAIQMAVSNYWDTGVKNMDALQAAVTETEQKIKDIKSKPNGDSKGTVALWITIPTALILVFFLSLAFWPKKTGSLTVQANKHKCPRCGWEHDPGDTVCRNPNCRTQF